MNADKIRDKMMEAACAEKPPCAFVWVLASDGTESSELIIPKSASHRDLGAVIQRLSQLLAQMQDTEIERS